MELDFTEIGKSLHGLAFGIKVSVNNTLKYLVGLLFVINLLLFRTGQAQC